MVWCKAGDEPGNEPKKLELEDRKISEDYLPGSLAGKTSGFPGREWLGC